MRGYTTLPDRREFFFKPCIFRRGIKFDSLFRNDLLYHVPHLVPYLMAKQHKQTPRGDSWRSYADTIKRPRSADSLKSVMRRCNRVAWVKAHRAQVAYEYDEFEEAAELSFTDLSLKNRLIRYSVAIILLLPLAIITAMSLGNQLAHAGGQYEILTSTPVWFGMLGALVCFILGCNKLCTSGLLFIYVLGHELTHALAVYCCLGTVQGFKANPDGGYITTSKNNLFIALSPYFIPLWGILWGVIWGIVHIYMPTYECEIMLYGGLGFWWSFHLFWTAWIIPRDQPDLAGNGTLFSLILVYFANLLLFLGLMRLFGALSFRQFFEDCLSNAGKLWDALGAYGQFIMGLFA